MPKIQSSYVELLFIRRLAVLVWILVGIPIILYVIVRASQSYSMFSILSYTEQNIISPLNIPSANEFEYLDKLAYDYSFGKDAAYHNYTGVYYKLFARFKNRPIKLLELGIWEGGSVQLWEHYFPQGELHFVDITDERVKYRSTRSQYHIFNASDPEKLGELAQKFGPFDIVIDDASHLMSQHILSFQTLFSHVKPGGLYVIEDMQTNYIFAGTFVGEGTRENPKFGRGSSLEFLTRLIDEVNYVGSQTDRCHVENLDPALVANMSYYARHIDSIHFYSCLAVVEAK